MIQRPRCDRFSAPSSPSEPLPPPRRPSSTAPILKAKIVQQVNLENLMFNLWYELFSGHFQDEVGNARSGGTGRRKPRATSRLRPEFSRRGRSQGEPRVRLRPGEIRLPVAVHQSEPGLRRPAGPSDGLVVREPAERPAPGGSAGQITYNQRRHVRTFSGPRQLPEGVLRIEVGHRSR